MLTSLLLLADELDLHHSRAVFKPNYPLSKVSKLHYFRHHFVQDVQIKSITKAKKQIEITLAIPESEKDKGWVHDLQSWLKQKLKYELDRTFQSIETGFDSSLYWAEADERVIFRIEEALPNEKKLPGSDVKKLLRLQNEHVIDWTTITKNIRNKFISRTGGTILLNGSKDFGNGRFFSFLSTLLEGMKDGQEPVQCIHSINFDKVDCDGSLESIIAKLSLDLSVDDSDSLKTLEDLAVRIKIDNLFCLVVLQNYDRADPHDWQELAAILAKASSTMRERFLFLVNTEKIPAGNFFEQFILPEKFAEENMLRFYNKQGYYGEKAEKKAFKLKKFQDNISVNTQLVLEVADSNVLP